MSTGIESPPTPHTRGEAHAKFLTLLQQPDVRQVNLAKTSEHVFGSNRTRLHVRSQWPIDSQPRAICVVMHGYAAHINRPQFAHLADALVAKRIAFVSFDFHGHGYSDGQRCYVKKYTHLMDDCQAVIDAIYADAAGSHAAGSASESASGSIQIPPHIRPALSSIPFFVAGHSMGGATAIAMSEKLQDHPRYGPLFRGCVLLCPAVVLQSPNIVVQTILKGIAYLTPLSTLPSSVLDPLGDLDTIWTDKEFIEYVVRDAYPTNPTGLSWGLNFRYGTGLSLLKLVEYVKRVIPNLKCPFVVLHDSKEVCVLIAGTQLLLERSATPADKKRFVEVTDARHDLLANAMEYVTYVIADWLESNIS
eukprot:TRINITY_DN3197_c0_g1_i1.p1 TRINITY_DN3197_c0_g1~~TRINITY_DN3197_c0_g1_i1.p1  ORF type:complete len:362 (+),score=75.40 TRINITY_DN3197_c0_g1_i1:59-1144(+)